jgi:hypothetical protein
MKILAIYFVFGLFMSFQSLAHVSLVYPEGGETFNPGETVNIQWEIVIQHNTQNWDLYFSDDGGNTWEALKLDISADSINYHWTVPEMSTTQARIRVVMDNDGNDYTDNSNDFSIVMITGINESIDEKSMSVYPNPMNESATISFANPDSKSYRLVLFNNLGLAVRKLNNTKSDKFYFKRNDLPAGLYYFRILEENSIRGSGKIVID